MKNQVRGRIVTFYSYKGGTGRSMALANIAWILASQGKRVLLIDWDLEAPGLHRYFAPLLADGELRESDGLIDWLFTYLAAATKPPSGVGSSSANNDWVASYIDLTRYTEPIEWQFPEGGCIDLVGAGRQSNTYAVRVNTFDWDAFYVKFFGARFLQRAFELAREEYDYIFIDSRTGVSDTAGICTVQLPDVLVVLFTLNRQSILGASSILADIIRQRGQSGQSPNAPPIQVIPVATRIDNAEKTRLAAMRSLARERFSSVLGALERRDWAALLLDTEIPYVPFYAYEEVLATIADERGDKHSVLAACECITSQLTTSSTGALQVPPPEQRQELRRRYSVDLQRVKAEVPASEQRPWLEQAPSSSWRRPASRMAWLAGAVALLILASVVTITAIRSNSQPSSIALGSSEVNPAPSASEPVPDKSFPAETTVETANISPSVAPTSTPLAVAGVSTKLTHVQPPAPIPPALDQPTTWAKQIKPKASSVAREGSLTPNGKQVYTFYTWLEMTPEIAKQIKSVDYFFDHPSFEQKHFVSMKAPNFTTSYPGWGCLESITVTITPIKGPKVVLRVPQCSLL